MTTKPTLGATLGSNNAIDNVAWNRDVLQEGNWTQEFLAGTATEKLPFAAIDKANWVIPQCRVAQRSAWVLLNNTNTLLNFNAADIWDTDTIHDTAVNNTRLNPHTKGIYLCVAQMNFAGNATGTRSVAILLNGAVVIANTELSSVGAGQTALTAATPWQFNGTTDYIELQVFQNSGGSLTSPNIGNYSTEFSVTYCGGY